MKRYVAFDVGSHTIGVAQSDLLKTIAQPVGTIRIQEHNWDKAMVEIASSVDLKSVEKAFVGLPKNMNNTLGESAERALRFKDIFEEYLQSQKLDIEVIMSDERLTTVQAEKILIQADMSRKKRKKVIDTVAAVLILETNL